MNETQTDITHEQKMRLNALEFASGMYIGKDGNRGDTAAEGFIAFANEVYKYIKEGNPVKDEIEF